MTGRIDSVAFFFWSPLTARDYHRFGIDMFRDRFSVRVFDCTRWLAPASGGSLLKNAVAWFPGYRSIGSADELAEELNDCGFGSHWAAIDELGVCADSDRLRGEIRARGARRVECVLGNLPSVTMNLSGSLGRLWSSPRRIPAALMSRMRRWRRGAPEFAVVAGFQAALSYRSPCNVIKAHSMDYEIAKGTGIEQALPYPYAVYLDEGIVSHPDYGHLGLKPPTTPTRFLPALNRFFTGLEAASGIPVVIAAHPRVGGCGDSHPYGDRKLIAGQTANLVRGAKLVLAHASTSISFAVIWNKPIAFLTSDDIDEEKWIGGRVRRFAEILRAPLFNIDHATTDTTRMIGATCDQNAYDAYRRAYIREDDVPDAPLWAIVGDRLAVTEHASH